jgi:superoxide dismutase
MSQFRRLAHGTLCLKSKDEEGRLVQPLKAAIVPAFAQSFGSWAQWRRDFHAIDTMRGVGWVMLCQDPVTRRLSNHWVTLHQDGIPAGFRRLHERAAARPAAAA